MALFTFHKFFGVSSTPSTGELAPTMLKAPQQHKVGQLLVGRCAVVIMAVFISNKIVAWNEALPPDPVAPAPAPAPVNMQVRALAKSCDL